MGKGRLCSRRLLLGAESIVCFPAKVQKPHRQTPDTHIFGCHRDMGLLLPEI
ncbi:hypothetical protein DEO72_LG7g1462 [Vigna unguiculata]|uniref:Uncharacterized protein n=1 Tax=Vigna unguiculata TaxID=3917 RepID=A0A4D6MKC0_VIGUN|nr:hypothetical protein DEO72_LG7g1462 [Vigna unguiculata]